MSDSITITINGQTIESQAGRLLIDVADDNNIVIPRFCYHKKLSVVANCRMCLVEIERAPKPMPACATHVTDGMVVQTRSASAIAAQKSTMEFLLINHPLDCPICDQGGECELQDVAMGFGEGISQYTEQKRVVMDKNIGPLIATDFTRCIHCTRCVRFGDEIAGLPELGLTGRGENVEIGTFIEKSIASELSGNVIDICPVGALTARPSRYTARPWELTQHPGIAAHDCIGSNIFVHTRGNDVIRVVPRENESINETWISDRDRFSYTALKNLNRITAPMMRENGQLTTVDWETAINLAVEKLSEAANLDASAIAALISPQATLEEHYLLQKLLRGLGSNNIDHRLCQVDFSSQGKAALMPWLGRSLESVESLDACLIVAGNLQQEQPMLSHRIRKAQINNNASVSSICHIAGQYNFDLHEELNGSAEQLPNDLAGVVLALSQASGAGLSRHLGQLLEGFKLRDEHSSIANSLLKGKISAVLVGIQSLTSPYLSLIEELCEAIAGMSDSSLGYLSPLANSAGAALAGSLPHRQAAGIKASAGGQHARAMMASKHAVFLSFGINPTLDISNSPLVQQLGQNNDFCIAINSHSNEFIEENADLVLPLASFTETSGTFVNVEGLWQSFRGCVKTPEKSRQGWKILTALGQLLLPGEFEYEDSAAVQNQVRELCSEVSLNNFCGIQSAETKLPVKSRSIQKISMVPIYASDELLRLCEPLQATPLMNDQCAIVMNRQQAKKSKLADAVQVHIKQEQGTAVLPLRISEAIATGCVCIPSGIEAVKDLTDAYGPVELEKVS
ncbi:MAG: NADH-quinone oxidoreductase subunit NuoG [Gammaproteobacteria bacterium]|nr:NADH-quinone oxidoreductase subunit NuoG [Gammaproteobacteria bacterium]